MTGGLLFFILNVTTGAVVSSLRNGLGGRSCAPSTQFWGIDGRMANYKAVLKQTLFGQEIRNILHYDLSDASDAGLQDASDAIRAAFDLVKGEFMSDWSLYGVDWINEDLPRPRVSVSKTFTAGALSGSSTVAPTATTTALLIRWLGTNAVPPNRGRSYIGGVDAENMVGTTGLWGISFRGNMQGLADDLKTLAYGSGQTGDLQIVRQAADGTPAVINPVASGLPIDVPATQRRRRIS